ncbi:MAG: hypothetical protein KKE30_13090 [Gammaproteobacteria bacterium]|nr:hypothetical protein [Gammaproteobacteria bacterium]MBU1553626.1 hypothetical protein [Gammaproteobacteria bacterium]MBU2069273.1 hypothetical protein [Gammaproteobacteria bacterium]MBU2183268.1 hypothetical protein [Gammaproteobacteria bacterium]MBU2204483.1 hypothetical protein [Gammaproteobacteria bacterium]
MKHRLLLLMVFIGQCVAVNAQTLTAETLSIGEVITLQYPSAVLQQKRHFIWALFSCVFYR